MSEELRTLIEQCEKVNAMVLNFNLYNAIDKKWF